MLPLPQSAVAILDGHEVSIIVCDSDGDGIKKTAIKQTNGHHLKAGGGWCPTASGEMHAFKLLPRMVLQNWNHSIQPELLGYFR